MSINKLRSGQGRETQDVDNEHTPKKITNDLRQKHDKRKKQRHLPPATPQPATKLENNTTLASNTTQHPTEAAERLQQGDELPVTPRPTYAEPDEAHAALLLPVPATDPADSIPPVSSQAEGLAEEAIPISHTAIEQSISESDEPVDVPTQIIKRQPITNMAVAIPNTEAPTESFSGKEIDNGASETRDREVSTLPPPEVTTLLSPEQDTASITTQMWTRRRVRINRILMRKRHLERGYTEMAPRVITFLAVLLILFATFLSSGAGATYAYYKSQLPLLDGIAQHSLFQTTYIYDRNGKLLYSLYDHQQDRGRRTYVNYADISPQLVNATVAAEDHSFWTNDGFDVTGIARAAVSDIQKSRAAEGGSTITQQLIKKRLFDNQPRTVQQKTEEMLLAAGLTRQYPKWKIMEMYLNTVYYGDINYGIEAAAQDYFNLQPKCTNTVCKPAVSQLDLAQSSLLAGLPQSPSYYNPITNKTVALARQAQVLQQMLDLRMITSQQMLDAQQETAKFSFASYANQQQIQAPHFVHYLIDQVLVPLLGADNLLDGGYSIYTTLDLDLEKKVEQTVYDHLYKPQYESYVGYGALYQTNSVNNGAAVVMNPRTGEILAMDGSAKYDENTSAMNGQFNAAISPRQPGSSFKPIVYASAFEMGWYPAMIVSDHKTYYPGNLTPPYYSPQNYDGTFHTGYPMTIRTAVANSYNIPAIDTIEFAGIPNVLNMAGRLGLTEVASRSPSTLGPSMAIGSAEVSLLHMTGAYATFANQGVRMPPTAVLKISNNQNKTIYQFNPRHPHGERVIGADVAYLVNSILSDKGARYHEFWPGNPLELDRPAAAKTGTTDSFRDNWTLGYTPYLAVGVWAGNSDNSIMHNVIGITGAGPIWHDIMEYASQRYNYPPDDFARPANVHQGTVSALTGLLPRPDEPTVTDWFIDGTMPTIQGSNYYVAQDCNNKGHHHKSCGDNQQNNG
ncbi:MAG TPA: transglycosylase domain-containing protein [Ktedonosporobacter sp.]|nr:transglycosylase domain-containing protein [Ktedonosporobacter sp.]